MAVKLDRKLKDTVKSLGKTLGEAIQTQLGEAWLQRIEDVRLKGRESFKGDNEATQYLKSMFNELSNDELLTVARAFTQFLNLANIAEQEHNSHHAADDVFKSLFDKLKQSDVEASSFESALQDLDIDLVLTAHPTEVSRRTFIHKYSELSDCLTQLNNDCLDDESAENIRARIADLITQAWHTDDIRSERPTPTDEAQWGFAVIENSLWEAVPQFVRMLDCKLQKQFGKNLPLSATPVHFSSWMGGDRDGNPFVTAQVTEKVLLLARKRAARLFAADIEKLQVELSMRDCDDALREKVGQSKEPYRALLTPLLRRLRNTHDGIEAYLSGEAVDRSKWINKQEELIDPLLLCYQSLINMGMLRVANSELLDTIRRAYCFGIHLLRLDVRQDSERHADVFSEITQYLGMGDYHQWSETEKQAFLLEELQSNRPLVPTTWSPSPDVKEVLDTCKVIAQNSQSGFGIYIISMASLPSDVLAVKLLLKETGISWSMPVAPLFETLDDLNNAPQVMDALMNIDWYKEHIDAHQFVMIGYSDSAKDAGAVAAGWAQYQSQEALVELADKFGIELTLFHGRGGTIGRGGLPAHAAILSQPPGSLKGGFRVTEQGETIRYKFGIPRLAERSLNLYASAILEAMLLPPPKPKQAWREIMSQIAANGRDNYRAVVRDNDTFVRYFREATPELELGKLPLGSRPAKRKPNGGIESLRAIPWIFAWAQTRMVLPSWLGVMKAMQTALDNGGENTIKDMFAHWPFFQSRLSMLDMVFCKADIRIGEEYDKRLVSDELKHFGAQLRQELQDSIELLLKLTNQDHVMQSDKPGYESMRIRAKYLQPLHFLQIELLHRIRQLAESEEIPELEKAMMITITGIAVGMRNTG
ncbi:phosphoenolpyruvate carboxylase [Alteromonas sp. a30]|uniref:phosphoenolpyruvate carboxylase n=1 Tax=Alteromonas sp. a30 TaxID=2730917 RepID=UPI0022814F86|nr:phosphoenolpyruvate carboxylase [Alteromonas sp. a30]MCY7294963.1 phosphoenolpyruvate carboxylase [Alteromonas sp. a30]